LNDNDPNLMSSYVVLGSIFVRLGKSRHALESFAKTALLSVVINGPMHEDTLTASTQWCSLPTMQRIRRTNCATSDAILALWERVLAPNVLCLNRARRDLCERCSAMNIPTAIGYLINAVAVSRADNWFCFW
jgi:hypothetical protein